MKPTIYFITNDYKNFVKETDKDTAIQMANYCAGIVFIINGDENLIIYNSQD